MIAAPAECAAARTRETEIGRALFRSPTLLGGPAARLGLSCNACHNNGRGNTRFMLPELTNRAGAADVTSEWASHVRGDGVMNPVDIPDLAGVGSRTIFGHAREPSLERFTRSVIEEEFQGRPPSDEAFAGLLAYLRSLDTCPAGSTVVSLATATDDVRRAVAAAQTTDAATARAVLLAAQDAIGRLVERLPARSFQRDRARLEALARELNTVRTSNDVTAALTQSAPGWLARFDAAVARIARREGRTYFNEATLRTALNRQR